MQPRTLGANFGGQGEGSTLRATKAVCRVAAGLPCTTELAGLWSRRSRVRIPSLTPIRPASRSSSTGPPAATNEYTIRYDDRPVMAVGIREFRDSKVVRERIYFGDPWQPPAWRAEWVERFDPAEPDASADANRP